MPFSEIAATQVLIQKVPDIYYQPKSWEKNGTMYERLGIKKISEYVADPNRVPQLKVLSAYKTNNYFLKSPTIAQMKIFEQFTRYNELTHLKGLLMGAGLGTLDLGLLLYTEPNIALQVAGVTFGVMNVANLYLMMLQRYNRARIVKILERKERNENK